MTAARSRAEFARVYAQAATTDAVARDAMACALARLDDAHGAALLAFLHEALEALDARGGFADRADALDMVADMLAAIMPSTHIAEA